MELKISVTFRLNDKINTRHYKSEQNAKRNIWKWLQKHKDITDISASYFSPENQYCRFTHHEQLSEYSSKKNDNFYKTQAWRDLRYQALTTLENKCALCNKTKTEHNIALEVDHILPRSKYPELALDINNLQILCVDCNRGKMAKITS